MVKVHFPSLPIYEQQVLFISFSFSFSRCRCSCSRKCHSKYTKSWNMEWLLWLAWFVRLVITAFLSLTERWKETSSSTVVEIVVCFVSLDFRCLFDCNQFQIFSQSNSYGVSSRLTNAKNHISLPFSSFSNCCEWVDFKSVSTFIVFYNSKRIKKKSNQIQNVLSKCSWSSDGFDQFGQNHN